MKLVTFILEKFSLKKLNKSFFLDGVLLQFKLKDDLNKDTAPSSNLQFIKYYSSLSLSYIYRVASRTRILVTRVCRRGSRKCLHNTNLIVFVLLWLERLTVASETFILYLHTAKCKCYPLSLSETQCISTALVELSFN